MTLTQGLPYPPGNKEKVGYYNGLTDKPKLVARTSSTPFVPHGPYGDTREFRGDSIHREPIEDHEITSVYSRDFARAIITALGAFPWHRFYPIRLGDYMSRRPPVVFIIETLSDLEPWETSIEAALACRTVIRSLGITDVEVEIQQVSEIQYAATKELDAFIDDLKCPANASLISNPPTELEDIVDNVRPFSSQIRYQIDNPKLAKAGTMGLHLRLGDADVSYGLTCRHAVLDSPSRPLGDGEYNNSGDKTVGIRQVNPLTARELTVCSQREEKYWRRMHRELEMKIKEWDERHSTTEETAKETAEAKETPRPTSEERERLSVLDTIVSQATKATSLTQAALDRSRIIGHVAYAPSPGIFPRGHFADWALVELDTAVFAAQPTNMVYINRSEFDDMRDRGIGSFGIGLSRSRHRRYLLDAEIPRLLNRLDDDGFLRISGVLPTPTDGTTSSFAVGTRGMATSKIAFGVTNEILAVRRDFTGDDGLTIVWEWIIFGGERIQVTDSVLAEIRGLQFGVTLVGLLAWLPEVLHW
ncbi:hypothetical protein TrVFT333_009690 [Trichoderma virens FT-333]|nr:hypothetical protein TrVFT333_009690 [Trichoderma virens FT-333]